MEGITLTVSQLNDYVRRLLASDPIVQHITLRREISNFKPVVYVDIGDVIETKKEAMRVFSTQPGMFASYLRKAEVRGGEAAGRGSRPGCKYAEAFSIYHPIAASGGFVW